MMLKRLCNALLLLAALSAPLAHAASDPTLHEIYQAADAGELDRAQNMIAQVLRDHPNSAKGHYVAAELDARQGFYVKARNEFATAERLQPGLPFAKPESVRALRAQLGITGADAAPSRETGAGGGFPLLPVLLGLGIIAFFIWLFSRRPAPSAPQTIAPYGSAPGAPPASPAGGLGASVASGLATGIGVGAGIVAGEALADRLVHGSQEHDVHLEHLPPADNLPGPNDAMGGTDFGVSDSGGGWDSGGAGDGGDWD